MLRPPETTAEAKGDPRLVGRWHCKINDFQKSVAVFLPDGRYFVVIETGGVAQSQQARYRVNGDRLVFHFKGADKPHAYTFALDEDILSLRGTDFGDLTLKKEAGSDKVVVEEARKADEAKRADDDHWRERFPAAVLDRRTPHVPVGEVPADPKPTRIFERPTVITSPQLYLRENTVEYIYENGNPPGVFKTHFNWHFLPTGRVYVVAVTYTGAVKARERQSFWGTYYVAGKNEVKTWGRYRMHDTDAVDVDFDDGTQAAVRFTDGRRSLTWGASTYGNVVWALEAIKQSQGK